ncbi:MAG: class I SAM-dependent methyltransferase [Planctomycetota bacterium]
MDHHTPENDAEIADYNRAAWDASVEKGNEWTLPVDSETIRRAAAGDWQVVLTPETPVPRDWFGDIAGKRILCLASGGGQQAPTFAAAGADVTVFDNSPRQLAQDQFVAQRDGLQLKTVQGDMRDLSCFSDAQFDLIFNPCSICFVPTVRDVFAQCSRVAVDGARFLFGFTNPIRFIFDEAALENGELLVRHRLPYSDLTHMNESEKKKLHEDAEPFVYSHSLTDLIAGQAAAGWVLKDMFEDHWSVDRISEFAPMYIATLATKGIG